MRRNLNSHVNLAVPFLLAFMLALPTICGAQTTKYDEDQSLSSTEAHVGKLTGHAAAAKTDYRRYCAGCHGELGDGEGAIAQWLDPKPRNFTLGRFRCRSTRAGTLPLDEDLFNSIGRGMDRSTMPPWNTLTAQQKVNLVAYIKHFSARWLSEKPGEPLQIPAEPEVTADRIRQGQMLFQKLECWKCHGVAGRANGPSAGVLVDDQNHSIRPYNFVEDARPKCGGTDRDLYRTFMTGLDGTPMPSFARDLRPDEAWSLVFYLRALQPYNGMNTKEKQIARQLGLKPINPNASLPDAAPAVPQQ